MMGFGRSRSILTAVLLVSAAAALLVVAACGGGSERLSSGLKPDYPLPAASYIGTDACLLCHQDKDKDFAHSRHWVKNDSRTPVATQGCESCHGPGSVHADNRGGGDTTTVDLVSFGANSMLSSRQQSAQCLQCHQRDHSGWGSTKHHQEGLSCATCHKAHGARHGEPTIAQTELCGSCHRDKKLALERVSHHPMREGKMQCSDCHNPHGSGRESNLIATTVNDLCTKCHTEKRGPHLWEHPPVVDNCLTCHDPHGSIHEKLLRGNIPYLCQRCHSDSRHPGTLYAGQQTFGGSTPSSRMFAEGCLNCHVRIHGSNHPSGHTFTR